MQGVLIGSLAAGMLAVGCSAREVRAGATSERNPPSTPAPSTPREDVEAAYAAHRDRLIDVLRDQGIADPSVLKAMRKVPRHRMVPRELRAYAYANEPLPIGHQQTISQPYIVGLMTELAELRPGEKVLEIGTGSGYQAAVLAELGVEVFSIELVEALGKQARGVLDELGYRKVQTRIGDGYRGWPEQAPFDAILITAAPPTIPEPLKQQLARGGRLVVPVGSAFQQLVVLIKTDHGFETKRSIPVRFVPMVGEAQRH